LKQDLLSTIKVYGIIKLSNNRKDDFIWERQYIAEQQTGGRL